MNEDLSSKNYTIECMKKGIEFSNSIFKWEIDIWSLERLKLMEENSHLQEIISKKDNEIADLSNIPPPPMNDLSQKISGWVSDNLKPLIHELGLEDKVMKFDKSFIREHILETLQELLFQNEMVLKSGLKRISQIDTLPN